MIDSSSSSIAQHSGRGRVERWFCFALTASEREALREEAHLHGLVRPEEAGFVCHPPQLWFATAPGQSAAAPG